MSPDRGSSRAPLRRGERVFLRLPVPSDQEEVVALRRRSANRLRPWEPRPPRGVSADPAEWFRRLLSFRRSLTDRKMLICLADSGAIVGGVSLNQIQRGAAQSASAGWWIGDPYEGCGLMADALCTALDHAFRDLRLHRVEANIRPENVRSLRLAERIGFRREGRSPRYLQIAGRWCDHDRFAMLAEEWPGRRRAISDAVRLPTRPGSRSNTAGSRPRC